MTVNKTSKIFFKISAILSFIILALCLVLSIGILFEIPIFEDSFKLVYQSIYEVNDAELEKLKFDFVINCFFSAIINFYAGRAYLNISKNKNYIQTSKKTMIFFVILQFIFGMMLASIFAIIGIFLYKPKTYSTTINQTNNHSNQIETTNSENQLPNEALDFCKANINELNKLLDEKKITQEQYDETLNNLLSVNYYDDKNI